MAKIIKVKPTENQWGYRWMMKNEGVEYYGTFVRVLIAWFRNSF